MSLLPTNHLLFRFQVLSDMIECACTYSTDNSGRGCRPDEGPLISPMEVRLVVVSLKEVVLELFTVDEACRLCDLCHADWRAMDVCVEEIERERVSGKMACRGAIGGRMI